MEAKREEFRKYLEKEGVLEFLTKQLVKLYEETDKPENALDYLKSNVVGSQPPANESRIEELEKENSSLRDRIKVLEEQHQSLSQQLEDKAKSEEAKDVKQEHATAVEKDTEVAMDTETAEDEEEKPKDANEAEPKEEIEKMVSDAEQTKPEDEKQKERDSAKSNLESYCQNMKSTVEEEKLQDKISDSDKETIIKKCDETMKWLEANQLAEVDEFLDQQKAVEGVCNPIVLKLEQAGSTEELPGELPGGTPGSNESAGASGGSTVEEAE